MFSGTVQQDEALTKTLADAGLSKWYAERGASMDTQIGGEEHALSGGEERRLDWPDALAEGKPRHAGRTGGGPRRKNAR